MSRVVVLACWASLTACFSDAPSTSTGADDDAASDASSGAPSSSSGSSDGAGSSGATGTQSSGPEPSTTGDSSGAVSATTSVDESSTGLPSDETLVLDIDIDVCGGVWTDDFSTPIACPSSTKTGGSVHEVAGDPVVVETLMMRITEDAIVTQPRAGATGEIRGAFALPPLVGNEHMRARVACIRDTGCDATVEIYVVAEGQTDVTALDTYAVTSANVEGVDIDVPLPADAEPAELRLYVLRQNASLNDTLVWISPRVVSVAD